MKYGKMASLKTVAREQLSTTGLYWFRRLTEDGEAVRGRTPRKKFDLNLNAEDNFALAA